MRVVANQKGEVNHVCSRKVPNGEYLTKHSRRTPQKTELEMNKKCNL